jgi:hypothetical protein
LSLPANGRAPPASSRAASSWAEAWSALETLRGEAEGLDMDPRHALARAVGVLDRAARRAVDDAMLIDSHVNLHHHSFDEDREAVIRRARDAGVGRMITICDKIENFAASSPSPKRTPTSTPALAHTRIMRRITSI